MVQHTQLLPKNQKKLMQIKKQESPSLCALCRGTKLLCGESCCPVIIKFHSRDKVKNLNRI